MMGNCIFCEIVRGVAPAVLVDEDEHTVAFMDIAPWSRGHAIVVSRHHVADLGEIDDTVLAHVFIAARRLAARMRSRLASKQIVLSNSWGATAGQVVPHFHLHVVPLDSAMASWPPRPTAPEDPAMIAESAALLRTP